MLSRSYGRGLGSDARRAVVLLVCRCRAEPLANYLAATMPGVHVVCFTTLCADVTCRLFTQALHAVQRQMQEETGLTSACRPLCYRACCHVPRGWRTPV